MGFKHLTLLEEEEGDDVPFLRRKECGESPRPSKNVSKDILWVAMSIAILSLLVHAILLLQWINFSQSTPKHTEKIAHEPMNLFSPFHDVIKSHIEIWPIDAWDNSIYVGAPSADLDAAWDELQAVEGISVSPEEAAKVNLTSNIILKNGDQGVVVGYFHNLHCIRYLYQGLHPDIYHRSPETGHAGFEHSYHCLEVLRRSVLCQPDLTLHEIYWQDEKKRGMTLRPESKRQCVDFSALYDFSKTRSFAREMIVDAEDLIYDQ